MICLRTRAQFGGWTSKAEWTCCRGAAKNKVAKSVRIPILRGKQQQLQILADSPVLLKKIQLNCWLFVAMFHNQKHTGKFQKMELCKWLNDRYGSLPTWYILMLWNVSKGSKAVPLPHQRHCWGSPASDQPLHIVPGGETKSQHVIGTRDQMWDERPDLCGSVSMGQPLRGKKNSITGARRVLRMKDTLARERTEE